MSKNKSKTSKGKQRKVTIAFGSGGKKRIDLCVGVEDRVTKTLVKSGYVLVHVGIKDKSACLKFER